MTQRQLAKKSGVPQPTIAAIEAGRRDPRFRTLDRLTRACGYDLDIVRNTSENVSEAERQQMRAMLKLTPAQRLKRLEDQANAWFRAQVAAEAARQPKSARRKPRTTRKRGRSGA